MSTTPSNPTEVKQKNGHQGEGGGTPSREFLYQKLAGKAELAIDYLSGVLDGTETANAVKVGAAKIILNKVVPDLKVMELQGNQDKPLGVVILPPLRNDVSTGTQSDNTMATAPGTADRSTNS